MKASNLRNVDSDGGAKRQSSPSAARHVASTAARSTDPTRVIPGSLNRRTSIPIASTAGMASRPSRLSPQPSNSFSGSTSPRCRWSSHFTDPRFNRRESNSIMSSKVSWSIKVADGIGGSSRRSPLRTRR